MDNHCFYCGEKYSVKPCLVERSKFCSRFCHDKGKTYKNSNKKESIRLRLEERLSVRDIADRTGTGYRTVAGHVKDVPLTSEERSAIRDRKLAEHHGKRWPKTNKALMSRLGEKRCQRRGCRWTLTLEVHHIDGDSDNNDPGNLEILCPNHHSITQNFRNRKRPH